MVKELEAVTGVGEAGVTNVSRRRVGVWVNVSKSNATGDKKEFE